eukprot:snap_masked-scaffold_17-processed-gene-3.20-mRNA-1 protein AED:1.00 eAED:1.00 QI:0/0/0/0/1/1/2/0/59
MALTSRSNEVTEELASKHVECMELNTKLTQGSSVPSNHNQEKLHNFDLGIQYLIQRNKT